MTSHWPEGLARFGRFEGLRCLGSGAFGVVYEAQDHHRGGRVALKALHRGHGEDLFRFKQEFRSLADLRHPNLVGLHELMSDGQDWFFTMELVEGVPFLDWVWGGTEPGHGASGPDSATATMELPLALEGEAAEAPEPPPDRAEPPRLDVGRLRDALGQLVQGLHALHRSDKLHCDIKPSNVLVTFEGQVRILDFGLVTELDPEGRADASRSKLVGTPNYMAPEQAAGQALSSSSDWYSLGAVLYEALTGQVPFQGAFLTVLMDKQRKDPLPPSHLNPEVPPDLDTLCLALLRRDPEQRPTADDLFRILGLEPGGATTSSSHSRTRPVLGSDHAPVGREGAMQSLLEAFQRSRRGWSSAWRIRGPHGTGKAVLLKAFLQEVPLRQSGTLVLQGRCYERESVPYKALDAVLDALSSELKRRPLQEVQALLPLEIHALARLFPVLRQVPAVHEVRARSIEIRDSQELRRRGFQALRELFTRLAERAPLILAIEDIQWADVDSAALLAEVLRAPAPPQLMLVMTQPSGEEEGPIGEALAPLALSGGTPLKTLDLADLTPIQARALAQALLKDAGFEDPRDGLADTLAREAGGNPFFIAAFVGECAGNPAGSPIRMEGFFERRIQGLSAGPRRLLRVLAVAGRPLEMGLAARAADVEADLSDLLALLEEVQLITFGRAKGRETLELPHRRVARSVLAELDPEALRETHLALAQAMEGHPGADAETMALHYLEGGRPDQSAQHARAAAEAALRAMAFDQAARLYRLLIKLSEARDPELQEWRRQLSQSLVLAGRGREAAEACLQAAEGASPAEALEFQRRAAEQYLLSGHIPEGLRLLESVLRTVHLPYPATPARALPYLLTRRWWSGLRGYRYRTREISAVSTLQLARIDTCWSAAAGLSMWDPIRGAYFQARHLQMALRAGEAGRIARALCFEAAYSATEGLRSKTRTELLIRKSQALAERVQIPYVLGLSHFTTGMARFLEGRWRQAHQELRQAEVLLRERCRGVVWELDMVQIYDLAALWFLGELRELSSRTPALLAEARERGDQWALTNLRARVAHLPPLLQGEGEQALTVTRTALDGWPKGDFHVQAFWRLLSEAETLLVLGRPMDAWAWVEAEHDAIRRSLVLRIQRSRVEYLHLRARCALAAAAAGRRALLPEIESLLRSLEKERLPWAEGFTLSLRAGLDRVRAPHSDAVLDLLRQAENAFEEQDMALYAAACRRHRGLRLGGEHGAQLHEDADTWMKAQGIHHPEAFARMLVPGV